MKRLWSQCKLSVLAFLRSIKSLLVLAEEVIKAWLPETQRTYQSQKGFNQQEFLGFNLSLIQSESFIWIVYPGYQLLILSDFCAAVYYIKGV